jgi:hypothetical protein
LLSEPECTDQQSFEHRPEDRADNKKPETRIRSQACKKKLQIKIEVIKRVFPVSDSLSMKVDWKCESSSIYKLVTTLKTDSFLLRRRRAVQV